MYDLTTGGYSRDLGSSHQHFLGQINNSALTLWPHCMALTFLSKLGSPGQPTQNEFEFNRILVKSRNIVRIIGLFRQTG